MNSDFSDLLVALNEESVEYLIVGGYAVIKYTEPRFTKDIDIWVNATPENAERVMQALKKFGAPLSGISARDFTDPDLFFQIGISPTRIDVIMGVDGLDFSDCWKRRESGRWDEIETSFISIYDLIRNKEKVGRPQDLIDVENLKTALSKNENSE
jgi:hypothetical protein